MIDSDIRRVILFVADRAWEIASAGQASPEVCLAIENLSDDSTTCDTLIAEIKKDLESSAGRE